MSSIEVQLTALEMKKMKIENGMNGTNGVHESNGSSDFQRTTSGSDTDMDFNEAEYEDPICNEKNTHIISFQDITSASFKIKGGVEHTPCPKSHISEQVDMDIYLKKEFLQFTGSFKERGARYALLMLSPDQKKKGVIAASLGNHAQGLSYHGYKLGIPVTVVMPCAASLMKIQKCKNYQANVIVKGQDMGEAKKFALKLAKDQGLTYINGYDHPHIIAGQGTIGLEIFEQVHDIDAVVIPVGGAGLIAGVGTAIKALSPHTKIIGVESEKCPSFSQALEHGGPIYCPNASTLADGLAVPQVGYNAYATTIPILDKMIIVKEEWIALAILRLVELEKCVVEGAGAAGLAALYSGHLDEFKGKRVVLLLCGGNIDTTMFGRCLERGLAADGRLQKFTCTVSDGPGGVSKLCKILADLGVSIKDIMHERAFLRDIHSVEVKVICETRDWEHTQLMRKVLNEKYFNVIFNDLPMAIENSNLMKNKIDF